MSAIERANSLLQSAYDLALKKGAMDPQEFYRLANAKANEIRDFLGEPGVEAELDKVGTGDRGPVALLGRTYDDLVRGVTDITKFLSPNPVFVAVKTFAGDFITGETIKTAAEHYGAAVADAAKAAGKPAAEAFRKARPWLIGGGILVAGFIAAYVWRSFK